MSRGWRTHAAALAALGGFLAALVGCGSSPATRFYTLTPVPPVTKTADRASNSHLGIGVRSVVLPADLDRPQIVTRTGPNTVQLAEFDRWSSSLRDTVANVIAANLSVLLPSDSVAVYPWPPGVTIDYQVIVEVSRFEARIDGPCELEAAWRILGKNQPAVVGHSSVKDVAGPDYASVVAAKSRLVGALSGEIAAAIRNGVPVTRQNQN
jgi:uncharacterized protein